MTTRWHIKIRRNAFTAKYNDNSTRSINNKQARSYYTSLSKNSCPCISVKYAINRLLNRRKGNIQNPYKEEGIRLAYIVSSPYYFLLPKESRRDSVGSLKLFSRTITHVMSSIIGASFSHLLLANLHSHAAASPVFQFEFLAQKF